jgi:hypothetical protein
VLRFQECSPSPWVLEYSESGDILATLVGFSRLFIPAHRLETSEGRGRVFVFTGRRHREVIARDAGLSPLEHPAPGSS